MSSLNHPHPGLVIRDQVLTPLDLSLREAAKRICVQPESLAVVLDGRAGITPELAEGLERAGFSTAQFWMALQVEYDRLDDVSGELAHK